MPHSLLRIIEAYEVYAQESLTNPFCGRQVTSFKSSSGVLRGGKKRLGPLAVGGGKVIRDGRSSVWVRRVDRGDLQRGMAGSIFPWGTTGVEQCTRQEILRRLLHVETRAAITQTKTVSVFSFCNSKTNS